MWAARYSGETSYFTPKYQLITPTIVLYEVYKKNRAVNLLVEAGFIAFD